MDSGRLPTRLAVIALTIALSGCASRKEKQSPVGQGKTTTRVKSSSGYYFSFPEGVNWNNATPIQVSEAVFAAVKENPDAALDISAAALKEALQTGRFPQHSCIDAKQSVDPTPSFWSFRWLFPKKNR